MKLDKKKIICVVCAVSMALLFIVPALALAGSTPEDEILQDYDIQGYDSDGNAILNNSDYEEYMNRVLQQRAEELQKKKNK